MHARPNLRRLVVGGTLLASSLGVGLALPAAHANPPTIAFDGSPGSGAPPATLGGYAMTAFGADPAGDVTNVTSAPGPTGDVTFDTDATHFSHASALSGGWSNSYNGDVYAVGLPTSTDTMVMTLPAGTRAFYFYAEGNACTTQNVTATSQDGATSGPVSITTDCSGPSEAPYFGFYSTAADPIDTITVTNDSGSGYGTIVAEFGIASAGDATWPFDDQNNPTADTSGNGNALTLNTGATFVPSPFGHALSLTGAAGANAENSSPVLLPAGGAARTLAAWIKPTAIDPGGAIISYGDGAVGGQEYILSISTVGGATYLFTDGLNGPNNIVLTGAQIPPAHVWSHVALVLDGSNAWTYYLNGVSTASGTFGVPINTAAPSDLRVGDRTDGGFGQPPFSGVIDSAAIYAQALTGAEVAALAANHAPSCASPQSGSTSKGTPLNSSVTCTDTENSVLTYSKVAGPSHGTAAVNADGTFTYTPTASYVGPDSFTFKANDGIVDSNTATYNVTVNGATISGNFKVPGSKKGTSQVKYNYSGTVGAVDSTHPVGSLSINYSLLKGAPVCVISPTAGSTYSSTSIRATLTGWRMLCGSTNKGPVTVKLVDSSDVTHGAIAVDSPDNTFDIGTGGTTPLALSNGDVHVFAV
jgi:hypothetical protein